ncbi:nucleotidyl transferase AbiEii/AbiGii toxin family protein [Algimonas porphyrae]|uniref:Nucleotidyl transferase AbiEii/AbiGii toxin family protein n=1 Tax=Algimonas porphyrae TaxID=1128113 RepID=A0ABQ5V4U7_9PROT|nr:nucleotidyl transferase AbiEii/AbiGii toxin family protein [Algimonas porphyrae]GLQ21307.1 hypothetical protein GCM10007854_22620 [Algimonas porphyrae]
MSNNPSFTTVDLPRIRVDVRDWILAAPNADARQLRQAVDITLNAIASLDDLAQNCSLKGGILMGLAYGSPRLTADIDLSIGHRPNPKDPEKFRELLDGNFDWIAMERGHPDMALKVGTIRRLPRRKFDEADFPGLGIKILYAHKRNSGQMARLDAGQGGPALSMDISFNEPAKTLQILSLTEEASILAYGLAELIAEKLRALLQQVPRRRERRQDPYDIWHLTQTQKLSEADRALILDRLITKSRSRGIDPQPDSLSNPEVRRRASANWTSLQLELEAGALPPFTICWNATEALYKALPWPQSQ